MAGNEKIMQPYPEGQMKKREYKIVDNHGYFPPVLLEYFNRGDLDLEKSSCSSEVRLEAGRKLAYYHHVGFGSGAKAIDPANIRVDGESGDFSRNLKILDAQDKYFKAIQVVPYEWHSVVEAVCIKDERITADGNLSKALAKIEVGIKKKDLSRALNRIARFFKFGND